jgi:hypothetical protein
MRRRRKTACPLPRAVRLRPASHAVNQNCIILALDVTGLRRTVHGGGAMESLAEQVAAELLDYDGAGVIWQAHITAARVYHDNPRAAEILLMIADAAEKAVRRGAPALTRMFP